MMQFLGYFLVGGLVVSLTTYFGSKGHGFVAAFVSMFPSLTVLTFFLIFKTGGKDSVITYAKSLAYCFPAWLLYVCAVSFLCERIGIWTSLAIGVTLYCVTSVCFGQLR